MNKLAILFLSIVIFLTACQATDSNLITLVEVLTAFEEQQLTLKEIKVSSKNIFGMKLNGVKPASYELDDKTLLVYTYSSTKDRKKGLEDFHNKTAAADVTSYNSYEVKNILIFYVHELDLSKEVELDDKIQKVVGKLNENE